MQRVSLAETLREIYKQQGDLSRYRSLRERFGQFDLYSDGVDPLGLELKIEHLLALARSEEDENQIHRNGRRLRAAVQSSTRRNHSNR